MRKYSLPTGVPQHFTEKIAVGRLKFNRPADLQMLAQSIAHNLPKKLVLRESTWSHWQMLRGTDVFCDIWPTVLKFRFPNGCGWGGMRTVQSGTVHDFLTQLISRTHIQLTEQADRDAKRNHYAERPSQPTEAPALPDDGKLPGIEPMLAPPPTTQPAVTPPQQPCHGRLELVLDGKELRVIIAEGTYCSSLRLNCADTRELLVSAAACLAQLDEPNPDSEEHPNG